MNSAINKTSGGDTSLTLEAQRNVTVNAGIASSSGALNVNLHSDTDGDGLGAVLINADIATNGGAFTSGSGTTIESGSVGTYFGNQGETSNRNVKTNGGAISLYGDVAIGLHGGTLTLDTRKNDGSTNSDRGTVTVTGTVDSGNSYKRVSSGLEGWEDFVKSYYDDVISKDTSSRYRYIDRRTGKVLSYNELNNSQKSYISRYLAGQSKTWAGAKAMAQGTTKGKDNTGDTYLATITTALENSLASPAEEYQLIVGGRGSGNRNNPADKQYPDGYYWVTGPEGMANNGKGTKFANNDGSAVNNYYVKWNSSYSQHTHATEKEPNNSGPMVSIGFGTASNWDDVSETATTIRGFVQEKNLAHSGLIINAGDSKVDIAGNLGNSVALKNVKINAGDVAIGSGKHYTGIVHSDEGVSITGKNVTVGDRITADTKGVDIQATGDIYVDGITSHENINLTTTDGSIVLDKEHNDGSLHTDSQDNDAVVIDVQGAGGSFRNLTSADVPAIKTGTGGNWKVYSYSPDADKFGTNLNSGTNAQWHANSNGANGLDKYAATNDGNKYIFQVQPTVYVTANDMTKVYGEELTNDDVTTTAEATFTGQDNKEHNVNEYTNAFNEGNVADYYNGSGTFTSEGWAKTATHTGGDKAPANEPDNKAIYNIKAAPGGYDLTDKGRASGYADATAKDGGTVEILRRQINVNGSGNQTYGNATINDWTLTATFTGDQKGVTGEAIVNGDQLDNSTDILSIKSGSLYADNKGTHTTADAKEKPYTDAVNMENVGFKNGAGVNYEIVNTRGDLKVDKANLTIDTDNKTTTYGTVDKAFTSDIKGLTNGDDASIVNLTYATNGYLSDTKTNDVGDYDITTSVNELKNYDVKTNTANLHINKAALVVNTDNKTTTYGTVDKAFTSDIKGLTNGDDASIVNLTYATNGYLSDTKTNDVGDYDITTSVNELKNYDVTTNTANLHIKQANLTIQIGNASTVYGTKFDESQYDYNYASGITNGDTEETLDAAFGGMNYTNDAALDGTDGKWTKKVGNYDLTGEGANSLTNYNVTYLKGTATVTPYTITKKDIVDGNPHFSTVYGTTTTPVEVAIKGVNGDATVENTATTSAYEYNADGTPVKTKDVGDKTYDITSVLTNKNYRFEDGSNTKLFANTASVTPADLTIQIGDASTVYGSKFDETKYGYNYVSGITNGDTEETLDAAFGGMNYTNDAALDGTDGKWTKKVGNYDLTGEGANSLTNYNVTYLKGTATVTPYTITEEEIVNPDGSPLYTTKYGQKDPFGKATFTGVNGDGTLLLDITDSSALTGAADGRITENVGDNIYDTTVSLESLKNKNYQFADGATSKTFENTASVTPAELTIKTKDVETEYGTVKETTSEVKGLVNGDLPTGFLFDYGDYGGAYLDGNTKTNDVNTYHFGTDLSGADFLNNYTITGGEADVKIDSKDVTFFVSGTGNTLADVTYTVDPDIDAQLAYGEHVDADYTPGNDLGSNQYGVVAHINGTPIVTGDVAGNYRYNYGGLITLSPTVPTKPDIDPHNPSNVDGSGSWTSNMGNHGVPGIERVAGLASAELPFFKVESGQVSHYGTYDVAADPDKVRLEPTGKRLPEPNQPKTQYREYTKALTTTDGTGMFRMVYDGSVFRITPVDDAALALVRTGDVKNNVELSAEALHAGFSEMGILLEDLDGVYVHFENLH